MTFDQLFKQITPKEICSSFNVFTLVGKDFYAATAGKNNHYNSMVGSGGGFGMLFKKPTTWCLFRKDRYTLEIIKIEQVYTLSYFPDAYKEKMLFLGSKSGRDSDKMKEVELTKVQTPAGNISFKEAKLIIECKLTAITTPNPDDFYRKSSSCKRLDVQEIHLSKCLTRGVWEKLVKKILIEDMNRCVQVTGKSLEIELWD